MVAEISFCPCMLWGKHCLGGAKWFSSEQLYHQDERHTQTYRRSHVRHEIHCNQRAWSLSTAPFWSEGRIENLTSKVRGGCQRGRQQYKKWNNEVRTCRRRDTGEMGHETISLCCSPAFCTLQMLSSDLHSVALFNGSSKFTDPTVLFNGTDSLYDNRSSYHKGESWADFSTNSRVWSCTHRGVCSFWTEKQNFPVLCN